ncbi:MAG: DEAD/DEAH box helicase [Atopobiaceae bacterium]|jgi:ATP-dependent RNA helicase RhlE
MDTSKFAELGLNEHILTGVTELGFSNPTPIQQQAIPYALEGRDVVASAQTGTGKTCAFVLPVLQRIAPLAERARAQEAASANGPAPADANTQKRHNHTRPRRPHLTQGPFALIITPTRELAEQTDRLLATVCKPIGLTPQVVMGGTKYEKQQRALARGCDVLVATPGRLIDLMEHHAVRLSQVKCLVLDEADRMLDMGFWPSVKRILSQVPKSRQTLLFSATIPASLQGTIDAMLNNPVYVEISQVGETADTVEEHLAPVSQGQKLHLLKALLAQMKPERALIFCGTKRRVDEVYGALKSDGFKIEVMHADRSQRERERALENFRSGRSGLLVATDVMSRGIDVSGIDAVINFDVPKDPEDYVHRIGRTGRAGHAGQAFTFVAPDEITALREVEYFIKQLIPTWDLEGFEYDTRIVPNPNRPTKRSARMMFSGTRTRGRGMGAGRYGRHT